MPPAGNVARHHRCGFAGHEGPGLPRRRRPQAADARALLEALQSAQLLEQTDDAILTLITCYPFWVLGPAPDRFVVRAELVANASFATLSVPAATSYEPFVAHTAFVAAASEGRTTNKPTAHDDTTLVRQAIERFRVTYNARLSRHHDVRPGGALTFHSCDVTFADSRAIATCAPGSPAERW